MAFLFGKGASRTVAALECQSLQLRKERELLLDEVNKSTTQIQEMEALVFQLDNRVQELMLGAQNVEAGTQVDDSQVESAVARKSSRGAWLLGDDDDNLNVSHQHKLLAAVSSEALPTSLTDALRKDPQGDIWDREIRHVHKRIQQLNEDNDTLTKNNHSLQGNLAELQQQLSSKLTEMTKLTKSLQSLQDEVKRTHSHNDKSENDFRGRLTSFNEPRNSAGAAVPLQHATIASETKVHLLRLRLDHERMQYFNDKSIMSKALEKTTRSNRTLTETLEALRSEKQHVENMLMTVLKQRKEAEERYLSNEEELTNYRKAGTSSNSDCAEYAEGGHGAAHSTNGQQVSVVSKDLPTNYGTFDYAMDKRVSDEASHTEAYPASSPLSMADSTGFHESSQDSAAANSKKAKSSSKKLKNLFKTSNKKSPLVWKRTSAPKLVS